MLDCPARSEARNLLLKEVDNTDRNSTIYTETRRLMALGQYIKSTKTYFLPEMTPNLFHHPALATPPYPSLKVKDSRVNGIELSVF